MVRTENRGRGQKSHLERENHKNYKSFIQLQQIPKEAETFYNIP